MLAAADSIINTLIATAPSVAPAPTAVAKETVRLIRGSDVTPVPTRWIWPGYLARGKFTILGGAPGVAKTTIALDLAAQITRGERFPDIKSIAPVGKVAIWSGEDDPADTLVPRLLAAGANMSNILFVGNVGDDTSEGDKGNDRPFDPAKDMEKLSARLAGEDNLTLLIVDPIVSVISGDSHKNAETRRGLQPLVDLGARMGCAILGVTHFTKGTAGRDPLERITGSLAFGALARIVLVAAKEQPQDDENQTPPKRMLLRVKSNISKDDGGFYYDVEEKSLSDYPGVTTTAINWGDTITGNARNILNAAEMPADEKKPETKERKSLEEAGAFLEETLQAGPVASLAFDVMADKAGFSDTTMKRAKKALGIKASKETVDGKTKWYLRLLDDSTNDLKLPSKGHKKSNPHHTGEIDPLEHENDTTICNKMTIQECHQGVHGPLEHQLSPLIATDDEEIEGVLS